METVLEFSNYSKSSYSRVFLLIQIPKCLTLDRYDHNFYFEERVIAWKTTAKNSLKKTAEAETPVH